MIDSLGLRERDLDPAVGFGSTREKEDTGLWLSTPWKEEKGTKIVWL